MVSWRQRWYHNVADMRCHGPEGNSVHLRGSGGLGILTTWPGRQVLQNISKSLSHPDQHTLVRSQLFMDTILGWPSWARCRSWSRKLEGIMIRVPRSTNFPITESWFLGSRYRLFSSPINNEKRTLPIGTILRVNLIYWSIDCLVAIAWVSSHLSLSLF